MKSFKFLGALGLSLLAAGSIGAAAGEASVTPTPPLIHGTNFQIKTVVDNSFCMETNAGTQSTGPSIYLKKCDGHPEQRWTLTDGANGTNVIVGNLGMCLDVNHGAAGHPKPAQISTCTYRNNQRFTVTADGKIIEVRSGECLTTSAAAADGDPVFLAACATPSQKAQHWQFVL